MNHKSSRRSVLRYTFWISMILCLCFFCHQFILHWSDTDYFATLSNAAEDVKRQYTQNGAMPSDEYFSALTAKYPGMIYSRKEKNFSLRIRCYFRDYVYYYRDSTNNEVYYIYLKSTPWH
jgi:hypothetical protein